MNSGRSYLMTAVVTFAIAMIEFIARKLGMQNWFEILFERAPYFRTASFSQDIHEQLILILSIRIKKEIRMLPQNGF